MASQGKSSKYGLKTRKKSRFNSLVAIPKKKQMGTSTRFEKASKIAEFGDGLRFNVATILDKNL